MPVDGGGSAAATTGKPSYLTKKSRSGAPLGTSTNFTPTDYDTSEKMPVELELLQQAQGVGTGATFDAFETAAMRAPKQSYVDSIKTAKPDVGMLALQGRINERENSEADMALGLNQDFPSDGARAAAGQRQQREAYMARSDEGQAKQEKVNVERELVEAADKAMRRGINQGAGTGTEELTLEQYQALNPKQRAAIDLNTMLVAAVKEDLSTKVRGTNPGGKEYDAQVAELGLDGEQYAPETVQLLDRINYDGTGAKLNDFLKLKVGFTANDLEDLEPEQGGPDLSLPTSMKQREDLQAALVNAIKSVRKDPADGNALLTQQRDLLNTDQLPGFGEANPQGSLDEQRNYFFQDMFERLARTDDKGSKEILGKVEAQLTEQDWQAFNSYLQVRSREAKQYSMPLGGDPSADYASPKIFRANTGLNR